MKVLLMTSHTDIGSNNAPPLGLYRLKNFLSKINMDCDILDLCLTDISKALIKARNGYYQIIGMSVSHYHMADDLSIIWKFREACKNNKKCLFIAGGQEATYNYEQWIKAGIDVVFLAYAERSLAELTMYLNQDYDYGISMLKNIAGVVYRHGNDILFNPSNPMNQSEFEYLNYEQALLAEVPYEMYWENARPNSEVLNLGTSIFVAETVRMYTSSHCPYNCGFCSGHTFLAFSQQKRAQVFMLNAEQIYQMILRYIKEYGAKGFLFSDDEFLTSRKRALELSDYIIHAKEKGVIGTDIVFNCQARVSDFLLRTNNGRKVDYQLMDKLANAGFHSISQGVETFCDRLLRSPSMNKTGFTEKESLQVIDGMLERGPIPQVNIIMFIPEATQEEIIYTMTQGINIIEKGCQVAVTPLLYSIPGAPIYGDKRYPMSTEKYMSPITNEPIEVTKYFVPKDPKIARIASQVLGKIEDEIRTFEASGLWKYKKVPKTIIGILTFVAAAKLMNINELAEEWTGLAYSLVDNKTSM